jgi:hypothetical protein
MNLNPKKNPSLKNEPEPKNRLKMITTISQFNSWPDAKKAALIEAEAQGSKPEVGFPGLLIYPACDMAILYSLEPSGNFKEAEAMPLATGLLRFKDRSLMAQSITLN